MHYVNKFCLLANKTVVSHKDERMGLIVQNSRPLTRHNQDSTSQSTIPFSILVGLGMRLIVFIGVGNMLFAQSLCMLFYFLFGGDI